MLLALTSADQIFLSKHGPPNDSLQPLRVPAEPLGTLNN